MILAIEDLQWIDKTSEEFLSYLVDWLAKAQILLILLYRPEYTHPWGSKTHYTKIGLDQLPSPRVPSSCRRSSKEGRWPPNFASSSWTERRATLSSWRN